MTGANFQAIINSIDKSFYKKVNSIDLLKKFVNTLAETYCDEMGLPRVETYFGTSNRAYASYNLRSPIIIVDEKFLKIFDKMADEKNFYFVYKLVDSIVHELRHHAQFSEIKVENGLLKNYIEATRACEVQDHIQKKYSYFLEPAELDARHYSFSIIKNNKFLREYYERKDYAKEEIENSWSNPFDFVGFLKDPYVQKKAETPSLAKLEEQVGEIAKKHNLFFIPGLQQTKTDNRVRYYNNNKLNYYIDKSIAPGFYDKCFAGFYPPHPARFDDRYAITKLTPAKENKIANEQESFQNAFCDCKVVATLTDKLLSCHKDENLEYLDMFNR